MYILYIFISIYFYTVPLAWSFTHSIIRTSRSYMCHTQGSIKEYQESTDLFFKAFLQCLSNISKCLPKKLVQEQSLSWAIDSFVPWVKITKGVCNFLSIVNTQNKVYPDSIPKEFGRFDVGVRTAMTIRVSLSWTSLRLWSVRCTWTGPELRRKRKTLVNLSLNL